MLKFELMKKFFELSIKIDGLERTHIMRIIVSSY